MQPQLRFPVILIFLFLFLSAIVIVLTRSDSQLLRTQANLRTHTIGGFIPHSLFTLGSNALNATVRLTDGSSIPATTSVEVATLSAATSPPSPSPSASPPIALNTEPNRTREQALNDLGPSCGNGLLDDGETCDFGDNVGNLSNCSKTCHLESSACNFFVGPSFARPGEQLTFSSQCFTEPNASVAIVSVNNKSGAISFVEPSIDTSRQGSIPGVFSRNIPRTIEGGGQRGFYLLRNGGVAASVGVNIHSSLALPETRLSGSENWDITLATPEYSTSANDPETFLVQLPSQLPPNTQRAEDAITLLTQLDTTCPQSVDPSDAVKQAGSSTISYDGQRHVRLTNAHKITTNVSSYICLYLETSASPAFELVTAAPLFERN